MTVGTRTIERDSAMLLRLSRAQRELLEGYARANEWTLSQAVREAIKVAVRVDEARRSAEEREVA